MNKINFKLIAYNIKNAISEHSPEILTGIGITGMVTAAILAVKVTPKAMNLIHDAEFDKMNALEENYPDDIPEDELRLTTCETFKTVWKCYIPATITGLMSAICIISAVSVNSRRTAALAAAYTLSESTLKEYQEKIIETVGDKKSQVVKDAVAQEKISKDPIENKEIIITNNGNVLFYDILSSRYFMSNVESVRKSINDLNMRMRNDMYISVNEYFEEIGLCTNAMGYDLGWNIDYGSIDIDLSSAAVTEDGRPCIVIAHHNPPSWRYNK